MHSCGVLEIHTQDTDEISRYVPWPGNQTSRSWVLIAPAHVARDSTQRDRAIPTFPKSPWRNQSCVHVRPWIGRDG